ncbi:uncharacterized protein LOC133293075 [Gastrolobium bilobum]|uniref:uncharacterized protein LOC133293075 n=1 Tax=Gastrolobium bilobum TaxID=150636 RepID=UPI002AB0F21D|nr:uncharacterized protein LOC133293075 [Gastrolobium bilobum]
MEGHKLLKRKGNVSDDFFDFSLSSPATKIRRLDAALPPIVEEEEPLPLPPNNERALVLFKPPLTSPSSFSLTLSSDLISGIKNKFPWSKHCDSDCDQNENDHRLALVPWVPSSSSQFPSIDDDDSENFNAELMEADEMRGGGEGEAEASMMMDIEQENTASGSSTSSIYHPITQSLQQQQHQHHQGIAYGGVTATVPEGFQHHCLLSQLPQNTSTAITWTR